MYYERTCWTERNANKLKVFQRKLFNKFFAGFIVNGEETTKYLLSLGVSRDKIHLGGMSADADLLKSQVEKYKQTDVFAIKRKKSDGLNFLFTGVVAERKGIVYLLSAWKKHIEKYP